MTFGNFFFLILIYVPLILLWIFTLSDLSHRKDISGVAKGFWAVAIVLLPVIGMIIYFITRPHDAIPVNEPRPAGTGATGITDGHVAELEKLAELKKAGALTDEEFATMKARVLG